MKPENFQDFAASVFAAPIMQAATAPTAAEELAAKVDELGALRSVIADLQAHADQIRTQLEDAGLAAIDGQHYSASFAPVKGRTVTDWEAIAQRFKPSAQLIRAYTKTGKPSTRLNVTARKITH
jgi:hypothetical protein